MEEPLRLRLVFEDRNMLKKSLRSEGLKHCWLLLNPTIATISDLESHVRKTFNLKRSCPNGIVLYMDDFVLPPFESAYVLKDKDIIRIRKKDATWMDVIEDDHDPQHIQDSGVLDKKHAIDSEKLLAITEFREDANRHEGKTDKAICIHNENAISTRSPLKSKNKRKHSDGILAPKTKKLKAHSMKPDITGEDNENIQNTDEVDFGKSLGSSQKRCGPQGCSSKSDKPSTVDGRQSISSLLENNIEQVTGWVQREKRNAQAEENIGGNICEPHVNGRVRKVQSRNARRKKEKRELLRKMKSQWRKNTQKQIPPAVVNRESSEKQETGQNTEMENDIVPVVVRPGHIRFQPLDEERCPWRPGEAMEGLQRSGTIINSEGQKWHNENNVSKLNASKCNKEQSTGKYKTVSKWNFAIGNPRPKWLREYPGSKWNDANGYGGQKWVRENTGSKWNDSDGYKGQKWFGENTRCKWNDYDGYKGQKWFGENSRCKWNNANGYKEQCNTSAGRWSDANGYKGQKCVRRESGSKWNDANGCNEQSIGKKTMGTWNDANGYKEQYNAKVGNWVNPNGSIGQKWVGKNSGSKWNDVNGCKEQWNAKGGKWANANGCKGQKNAQSKWNAANGYNNEQSNGNERMMKRWTDANGYSEQCVLKASSKLDAANGNTEQNNSVSISLEEKTENSPFESLFPLTRIPQVGDVLAYRLIELSPSWCPEISSFRVGEVTSYNYLTMSIILVPVPEFPIFSDENIERTDSTHKAKPSLYNEDGSLQIHYPSLVDVRLLKACDSEATTSDYFEREISTQAVVPVNKWEVAIANTDANETVLQPKENGNASISTWDQIKQAINERKTQLQKQDGWDEWPPNKRNGWTSWSYQAMWGSATGPNLANMRGRNSKYQYGKC